MMAIMFWQGQRNDLKVVPYMVRSMRPRFGVTYQLRARCLGLTDAVPAM